MCGCSTCNHFAPLHEFEPDAPDRFAEKVLAIANAASDNMLVPSSYGEAMQLLREEPSAHGCHYDLLGIFVAISCEEACIDAADLDEAKMKAAKAMGQAARELLRVGSVLQQI